MKKRSDGYIYGMTVDFSKHTFCVSRSSTYSESKKDCSAYLNFNLLTRAGKAMVKRHDDGKLRDGDLEEFDELLVEVMDTYLFQVPNIKIKI